MMKLFKIELLYSNYFYLVGIVMLLRAAAGLLPVNWTADIFVIGVITAVLFTNFAERSNESADFRLMKLPESRSRIAFIRALLFAFPWALIIVAVLLFERIVFGAATDDLLKLAVQLGEIAQIFFSYVISRDVFYALPNYRYWIKYMLSIFTGLAILSLPVIAIIVYGKFEPIPGTIAVYGAAITDVVIMKFAFESRKEFLK